MTAIKHRGRFVDRTVVCAMVVYGIMVFWIGPEYLHWGITKSQMLTSALAWPIILVGGYAYRLYAHRRCPKCSGKMDKSPNKWYPAYAVCRDCDIREDLLDPTMSEWS